MDRRSMFVSVPTGPRTPSVAPQSGIFNYEADRMGSSSRFDHDFGAGSSVREPSSTRLAPTLASPRSRVRRAEDTRRRGSDSVRMSRSPQGTPRMSPRGDQNLVISPETDDDAESEYRRLQTPRSSRLAASFRATGDGQGFAPVVRRPPSNDGRGPDALHVRNDTVAFDEDRDERRAAAETRKVSSRKPLARTRETRQEQEGPVRSARNEPRRSLAGTSARVEAQTPRQSTPTVANPSMGFPNDLGNEFMRERLAATQRELTKIGERLRKRETEVLKLRRALNRAAQELGPTIPDVNALASGVPPAHAAGLTLLPVPLHLSKPVVQQHGYLDVLDVEKHVFTSRKWKRRYVVADDRGISTFRTREDFVQNAFHLAKETIQYRQCEYFVPNVADSLDRLPEDDSLADGDRRLMLHNAASEPNRLYFGLIARQPPGLPSSDPVNPTLLLRTESIQEHEDWVHFVARMFNIQLYKQSFPLLFGPDEPDEEDPIRVESASPSEAETDDHGERSAAADQVERHSPLELPPQAVRSGAASEHDDDGDDDTVMDHGSDPGEAEIADVHSPAPPSVPPPQDALTARKPARSVTSEQEAEVQTMISVSMLRGDSLKVVGGSTERSIGMQTLAADPDPMAMSSLIPAAEVPPAAVAIARAELQSTSVQTDDLFAPPVTQSPVDVFHVATQASGQATQPEDAFAVASLQAELLQLRNKLTSVEASRAASDEALRCQQKLVETLEADLAAAKSEATSADDTIRCLTDANELADADNQRLRALADKLRRETSMSPTRESLPSESPQLHSGLPSRVPHARAIAEGHLRRRQELDDRSADDCESHSSGEACSLCCDSACSQCTSGRHSASTDLEDFDFRCSDCKDMYHELTRVVDERDGLLKDIARRHHEYELGIADMCDRVIGDMDALHELYRQGTSSESGAIGSRNALAMVRLSAGDEGSICATLAVAESCSVKEAQSTREGSKVWTLSCGAHTMRVEAHVVGTGSLQRRRNTHASYVARGPQIEVTGKTDRSRVVIPHAMSP